MWTLDKRPLTPHIWIIPFEKAIIPIDNTFYARYGHLTWSNWLLIVCKRLILIYTLYTFWHILIVLLWVHGLLAANVIFSSTNNWKLFKESTYLSWNLKTLIWNFRGISNFQHHQKYLKLWILIQKTKSAQKHRKQLITKRQVSPKIDDNILNIGYLCLWECNLLTNR